MIYPDYLDHREIMDLQRREMEFYNGPSDLPSWEDERERWDALEKQWDEETGERLMAEGVDLVPRGVMDEYADLNDQLTLVQMEKSAVEEDLRSRSIEWSEARDQEAVIIERLEQIREQAHQAMLSYGAKTLEVGRCKLTVPKRTRRWSLSYKASEIGGVVFRDSLLDLVDGILFMYKGEIADDTERCAETITDAVIALLNPESSLDDQKTVGITVRAPKER